MVLWTLPKSQRGYFLQVMKIPEYIPFHFDKFNSNLFRKFGAVGIGRWCLIRKAVAEQPKLTINLNEICDRESLELDSGCTTKELDELLDYAAQRGMIDANLYGTGILWIEGMDDDLGSFFRGGKRKIPERPSISRKNSETSANLPEKFLEVADETGISEHEYARVYERNERNVTNELSETPEQKPDPDTPKESGSDIVTPWAYLKVRKSIALHDLELKYTYIMIEDVGIGWEKWLLANKPTAFEERDIGGMWKLFDWYANNANTSAKKAAEARKKHQGQQGPHVNGTARDITKLDQPFD